MPIYEYRCLKCLESFEKLFFMGDRELVICPKCGSKKTKKLLSSASFMNTPGLGTCGGNATKGFS
ncbi:MAG: transcriptional regulator [Desulfobacterales bacterium S7086C20]|nr:MAG: transcriptional regulator [Desulfobacterales bacterium S7086C20]